MRRLGIRAGQHENQKEIRIGRFFEDIVEAGSWPTLSNNFVEACEGGGCRNTNWHGWRQQL